MTPASKKTLVSRFFAWIKSKGCSVDFTSYPDSKMKALEITQYRDGEVWNTICYEPFEKSLSDADCKAAVVDRLVRKTLAFGFFERLGLEDANSYEELELKLSVLGAE